MVSLNGGIMIKSITKLFISIMLLISLVGCNIKHVDPDSESERISKEILDAISNDDIEGLKDVFCDTIVTSSDFDEQIQEAFDFFEGEVTSYDISATSSEETLDYGEQKYLDLYSYISDIKTTDGKTYVMCFEDILVSKGEKDSIGVSQITIVNEEEVTFVLGDYYKVNPEDK